MEGTTELVRRHRAMMICTMLSLDPWNFPQCRKRSCLNPRICMIVMPEMKLGNKKVETFHSAVLEYHGAFDLTGIPGSVR